MKNFTISLYGFHLRHTLTDAPDAVAADAALLWENLVKLGECLPLPGLQDLRSQLICYQNGRYDPQSEQRRTSDWLTYAESGLPLGKVSTEDGFQICGDLQPFRLNDTYAVDLTLFPKPVDTSIGVPQLESFNPQGCLLPASIEASLGQTLWLYGEVDTADEECEALARVYLVALLVGTNLKPVLIGQSKLLGSLIFEYEAMDPDCSHPAKQCHVLVSLNNSQAPTGKLAADAYDWVLNWLCCRHKILYSYHESRDRYPDAQQLYSAVEQQVNSLPTLLADPKTRLESLSSSLVKIPLDALN